MPQWEQLGYVRDSDEEDESQQLPDISLGGTFDLDLDSSPLRPEEDGAGQAGEGGGEPHQPAVDRDLDEVTRPLTPILSSPVAPSSDLPDVGWLLDNQNQSATISSAIATPITTQLPPAQSSPTPRAQPLPQAERLEADAEESAVDTALQQRNQPEYALDESPVRRWRFRDRTALQLNPYALERQNFLYTMRGVGVAVQDMTPSQDQATRKSHDTARRLPAQDDRNSGNVFDGPDSSQTCESAHSSDDGMDLGASMDHGGDGGENETQERERENLDSDGESLPDVDNILTRDQLLRGKTGILSAASKERPLERRKISTATANSAEPARKKRKTRKNFKIPPEFQIEHGGSVSSGGNVITGIDLVSSEAETEVLDDNEDGISPVTSSVRPCAADVLPPSWICLDTALGKLDTNFPESDASGATILRSSSSPFRQRIDLTALAEPEDSDWEDGAPHLRWNDSYDNDGDIPEVRDVINNDFSYLNVPRTRSEPRSTIPGSRKSGPQKRQPKILDAFKGTKPSSGPSLASGSSKTVTKRRSMTGSRPTRKRTPRSVLEVPDNQIRSTITGEVPLFMRIAKREARRVLREKQQKKKQPTKQGGSTGAKTHPLFSAPTSLDDLSGLRPSGQSLDLVKQHNSKNPSMPNFFVRSRTAVPTRQPPTGSNLARRAGTARKPPLGREPYRAAQLETLEPDGRKNPRLVFRQNLDQIEDRFRKELLADPWRKGKVRDYLENRIEEVAKIEIKDDTPINELQKFNSSLTSRPKTKVEAQNSCVDRKARMTARAERQAQLPVSSFPHIPEDPPPPAPSEADTFNPVLTGLKPASEQYPVSFDVRPLQNGTFFHSLSFVGSGRLDRFVKIGDQNWDQPKEPMGRSEETASPIGAWDPQSRAFIETVLDSLASSMENQADLVGNTGPVIVANIDLLLAYLSCHLYFLDPAHKDDFASFVIEKIVRVADSLESLLCKGEASPLEWHYRCLIGLCCTAHTVCVVAVNSTRRERCLDVLRDILLLTVKAVFRLAFSKLLRFLERNRLYSVVERGITDEEAHVQAIVVVLHLSLVHHAQLKGRDERSRFSIWELLSNSIDLNPKVSSVTVMDRAWHQIYSLLPFIAIDSTGTALSDVRDSRGIDNWPCVSILVQRPLDLYGSTTDKGSTSANGYIRAVIRRCNFLISDWGWWRSVEVLKCIFDFFAKRQFRYLDLEEVRPSGSFLDRFTGKEDVKLLPGDSSFTLFLKTLLKGVQEMSKRVPPKSVQNTVWRFIPLHSRSYSKEKDLIQGDLDALRNHHDLVCTIYCASPAGFRPRYSILQRLVDYSSSHIGACLINIRAWTVLLLFQLAQNEPVSVLDHFTLHFREMISSLTKQYQLAYSEAKKRIQSNGQRQETIPESVVRTVMRKNQAAVLSCIVAGLVGMKRALGRADRADIATGLMDGFPGASVYSLFECDNKQIADAIVEVFDLIRLYVGKLAPRSPAPVLKTTTVVGGEDDSQEYGPWPSFDGFDEMDIETTDQKAEQEMVKKAINHLDIDLFRFVANYFGADSIVIEQIATEIVAVWALLAATSVKRGLRNWSDYLDHYGSSSISRLRETELLKTHLSLFYSQALVEDPTAFDEGAEPLVKWWLGSIVERESKLRYQNKLLEAILNSSFEHPFFENLPFEMDPISKKYAISMSLFRERRVALISMTLSNISYSLTKAGRTSKSRSNEIQLRSEYGVLIRHLITTMKSQYLELKRLLKGPSDSLDQYIVFVQRVVQLLEQHVASICPVDEFFLDNRLFPLPSGDPTYTMGRLKRFASRERMSGGTAKQLASFVYNLIEKAVLDGEKEEAQMVELLTIVCLEEDGTEELRRVIVGSVFRQILKESSLQTGIGRISLPVFAIFSRLAFTIGATLSGAWGAYRDCVATVVYYLFDALANQVSYFFSDSAEGRDVEDVAVESHAGYYYMKRHLTELVAQWAPIIYYLQITGLGLSHEGALEEELQVPGFLADVYKQISVGRAATAAAVRRTGPGVLALSVYQDLGSEAPDCRSRETIDAAASFCDSIMREQRRAGSWELAGDGSYRTATQVPSRANSNVWKWDKLPARLEVKPIEEEIRLFEAAVAEFKASMANLWPYCCDRAPEDEWDDEKEAVTRSFDYHWTDPRSGAWQDPWAWM